MRVNENRSPNFDPPYCNSRALRTVRADSTACVHTAQTPCAVFGVSHKTRAKNVERKTASIGFDNTSFWRYNIKVKNQKERPMKNRRRYRLTPKASLIIRIALILCILEGCLAMAYIINSPQFGAILARRAGAMFEHIAASLTIAVGGALLIDRLTKNNNT